MDSRTCTQTCTRPYLGNCHSHPGCTVRYAIVRRPNDTLNVRVHQRGSTRYVAIGVSVPHYAWLKAGRIKADHPGAARVNERLAEIRRQLDLDLPGEESLERAVALTRRIVRGDSRELVAYFRAQAAAYAARGQTASAVRLKGAIDHLAAFVRRPIQARDLTARIPVGAHGGCRRQRVRHD